MEDLFSAEEVIKNGDAYDLWDGGYYEHAKRWLGETAEELSDSAMDTAEELRSEMFQHCVNDANNAEKIKELASDLSLQASELRMRLELVEKIADKVMSHEFDEDDE